VNSRMLRRCAAVVASGALLGAGWIGAGTADAVSLTAQAARQPTATAKTLDLAHWMGQTASTLDDVPLDRMAIPGSHDSTSWDIDPTTGVCPSGDEAGVSEAFPAIASSMSVTQSGSIIDQLDGGARYLDLRLCDVNGIWYGYHGGPLAASQFFDANGVAGQADQIGAWIRSHPKEIVVISVSIATSSTDPDAAELQALTDMAQAIGGSAMTGVATEPQLTPDSTYAQFMAAGAHAVLIDANGNTPQPWAWPADISQDRGSYNYASPTWTQWLAALITGNGLQQITQTTLSLCTAALQTDPSAYPDSFFTLSTITDPTLTIPDAVFAQVEAALGLIPASVASHYLLYEEDILNSSLLQEFRGAWGSAPLSANVNIVTLDDINESAPGMPAGTLPRLIIALNDQPGRLG
jgi:hypothetical protein